MKTLRKTAGKPGSSLEWDETFCVSLLPRDDQRMCFDLRAEQNLLHFGCTDLTPPWEETPISVLIDKGATVRFTVVPPPPPSPPMPPRPPPPPGLPPGTCNDPWCDEFPRWVDDHSSKFHRMWGGAWELKGDWEGGCWDGLGGREWLGKAWGGTWCDRNWMQGSAAPIDGNGHPAFSAPAPALLGFDEVHPHAHAGPTRPLACEQSPPCCHSTDYRVSLCINSPTRAVPCRQFSATAASSSG